MTGDDARPLCLAVMSCIAVGPKYFLPLSEDFRQRYRFVVYANHQAQTLPEQMVELKEEIHGADVFIYHSPDWMPFLGDKREAYEEFLENIPERVTKISVPIPHLHAFWPFHSNDPRNAVPNPSVDSEGNLKYPYGDSYVLKLLKDGIASEEVISQYLGLDVSTVVDLDKIMSYTLSFSERGDRSTDVKVADFVAENFRAHGLFQTVNHANNRLLLYMGNQVLAALRCGQISERVLERIRELTDAMPVHPSILRYFGAAYGDETTRYAVDRIRYLTFGEYIRDYVYFA
jgi:hypothetical protein